jgi:hypothetical protein
VTRSDVTESMFSACATGSYAISILMGPFASHHAKYRTRGFLWLYDADVVENTPKTLPKGSRDLRSLQVLHKFRLCMRTPESQLFPVGMCRLGYQWYGNLCWYQIQTAWLAEHPCTSSLSRCWFSNTGSFRFLFIGLVIYL